MNPDLQTATIACDIAEAPYGGTAKQGGARSEAADAHDALSDEILELREEIADLPARG